MIRSHCKDVKSEMVTIMCQKKKSVSVRKGGRRRELMVEDEKLELRQGMESSFSLGDERRREKERANE